MQQINTLKASLYMVMVLLLSGLTTQAQLNGTYTVYGAGANYATLADAVNALNAGVSGPVTFKIRPGTWSSSSTSIANLTAVTGASATNTITFEAENGTAATTIIQNTSTSSSSSSNHIFYFNGADYVKVRNLTLQRTSSTYACAVRFAGSATYNTVENCIMNGGGTSTSSSNYRVYGTSLSSAHHNTIKNNTIDEGYYGIYWRGSGSSSLTSDNVITGNTLTNIYYYGVYVYYTNNQEISNNTITSKYTNRSFYGLYSWYSDGGFKFDGNNISRSGVTSSSFYPMYIYYSDGTSTNRGSISGNTINISSSTFSYGINVNNSNYYSINNNVVNLTGSSYKYPLYNYNYNSSTAFPYGKDCYIEGNTFTATTNSTVYIYAHYYRQKNTKFNNNTVTISNGSGSTTLYLGYYYQYNAQLNDNKITITGTSGSKNIYANYYYAEQGFEYNNNEITVNTTSGSVSHYAGYYLFYNYDDVHINNNKITFTATSSAYLYNYLGYYNYNSTADNQIMNNEVSLTTNGYGVYNYMAYYFNGANVSNNKIFAKSNGYAYGCYTYGYSGGSQPWVIKNNDIVVKSGSSTAMGLYFYYCAKLEMANNSVYAGSNSSYAYGLYGGYNNGGSDIYNNTVHTKGNYHYTFRDYQTSSSQKSRVYNNVFSRSGSTSGYLVYAYNPNYQEMDYNNIWGANGGGLIYYANTGQTYSSITAWRAGTGQNMNSLTYDPGYMDMNNGDLRPDPTNANSWSLNGRGTQMAGNDKDINGNARALTTVAGVPDLGAYEFTPTATPPNCTLTPATPAPSSTQVVTFGQDTVAVLDWSATVPTGFNVKQYTGTLPPGITTINPTQMFYYVDFQGSGTGLDYEQDLYFKTPWLGTIASKSALRLAEKVGTGNWASYSPAVSKANIVQNLVNTPGVNNLQSLYTCIDVSDNAGVDAIVEPESPFCPGTYNVKLRILNNGNNTLNKVKVAWQLNGGAAQVINHTTPIYINGSTQGNEAIITLGAVTFGSGPVNIKAWTFEPNGVTDPVPTDDTLEGDYHAALGGTYTVGGITPDFPTVIDAVDALNQFGTCGSVIFNIRPGTYVGQLQINNPTPVANTQSHVTFQAENGIASSVTINHATSSSDYPVIQLNSANDFTFRNLTVTTGPSYGHCFSLAGNSKRDSIIGCIMTAPTVLTTYNTCILGYSYFNSFSGNNIAIVNNKMSGGYSSVYLYAGGYIDNIFIDNNEMHPYGYYGIYTYYTNGLKITNNTINPQSGYNTYYGISAGYSYQSPEISNNRINNVYGYGMYLYQVQGSSTNRARIMNNSVITMNTTTCYYGMNLYYPSYTDIMHNTIINNGTTSGSYYAANIYLYNYGNNKIYNNVFANLAGGYALNVYYLSGYNNEMDYNNLYTTGTNKLVAGTPSATSLAGWRTASGMDKHSVTYDPAITSSTNPKPDVTNPAVWALNGHALHMSGDTKDIDGNNRFDNRADGVPDLGAYEIVPESAPPAATAVPAIADKGDLQIFTFAGNEVGRIQWGNSMPTAAVTVQQYSGERANGVAAAASPSGSMYFHTDITPSGNAVTFDYELNMDYMDIWLGDIPNDQNLRIAHRVSGYPWMVYSGNLSSVNTTTKNLDGANFNRFGAFTGLENNSVPSAFVRSQGSVVICIGNGVVLNAEPNNGDYYEWYRNGVAIPGTGSATPNSYTATTAGDYSVHITFTGKVVESVPTTVSTIAAPNALISASGPLTYCTGSGLTLDAGNTPGVTFQWQLNGNDIPGATNSTYGIQQAGSYTVVATNIGCSSVSTPTTVTSGPLNVSLGNDTSYCEVKNVYMRLDAGYPGARYLWNTGDTTQIIEVKQGGNYQVTVNGGVNCIGKDDINVTIDPLPKANGISFVQNGNSYTFSPSGPVGATGFLWLFSDGTTSTQTTPTKVLQGDDLYVRLVMFNACGSDTVQLGWPLSVSTVGDAASVEIYPNPATSRITIEGGSDVSIESVEILNSVGAVVYRSEAKGNKHTADISVFANGHYMLRASTSAGTISKQFDVTK